jgi:hypothetical protein
MRRRGVKNSNCYRYTNRRAYRRWNLSTVLYYIIPVTQNLFLDAYPRLKPEELLRRGERSINRIPGTSYCTEAKTTRGQNTWSSRVWVGTDAWHKTPYQNPPLPRLAGNYGDIIVTKNKNGGWNRHHWNRWCKSYWKLTWRIKIVRKRGEIQGNTIPHTTD